MASIKRYTSAKMKDGNIPTLAQIQKIQNQNMIEKIQREIDKDEFEHSEILEKLKQNNELEDITKALLTMVCGKTKKKEETKINIKPGENVKLFFNLGRKDNMKAKDFVGSIAANCGINGDKLGKINILDKFSFIEVPGEYVEDILKGMTGKEVKGRKCNVEIANN